jgi:hypothetical protein
MWRHLVLTGIVYLSGHPTFDGSRPSLLDAPLQGFYYAVNEATLQGEQILAGANAARLRYQQVFMEGVHKQIDEVRRGK